MKSILIVISFLILGISSFSQSIEQVFIDKLNSVRAGYSLPIFNRANSFDSAANHHANWIVRTSTLSHTQTKALPNTKLLPQLFDRGKEFGETILSENLIFAIQYTNGQTIDSLDIGNAIYDIWENSKPHLQNMLINYGSTMQHMIGISLSKFPDSNSCTVVVVFGIRSTSSALLVIGQH